MIPTRRSARAAVDLGRLDSNYRTVAAYSPVPLLPVVKADAYGHGAARVAAELEGLGAERLAVTYVEEAIHLRRAGSRCEIVVMAGFESPQLESLWAAQLVPVVSTGRMVRELADAASRLGPIDVHLKVDIGMARLGFDPRTAVEAAAFLARRPNLRLAGLMSHLSAADDDGPTTMAQLDLFDAVVADLARNRIRPQWIHATSSASLGDLRPTHTLARPGLLLYGLRPGPRAPVLEVRPVMEVSAGVLSLREVPSGTGVSYGSRFVTGRPSRIAVVPLGYADGVPRTQAMSREGWFQAGARRAPVAGAVCMDFSMLDVTDVPTLQEGDAVAFFGDAPTAWDVAAWAGTTVWQVLTAVGGRLPRVYVRDGGVVAVESCFGEGDPD